MEEVYIPHFLDFFQHFRSLATEEFNFTSKWEASFVTRVFSETNVITNHSRNINLLSDFTSFIRIDFEATTHQGVIMIFDQIHMFVIDSLLFRFRNDVDGCHLRYGHDLSLFNHWGFNHRRWYRCRSRNESRDCDNFLWRDFFWSG